MADQNSEFDGKAGVHNTFQYVKKKKQTFQEEGEPKKDGQFRRKADVR